MLEITSQSNEKIKFVKALAKKKGRSEYKEYTVEGIKSVHDAIHSNREITALYVSSTFYRETDFEYPAGVELYTVSDGVFEKMCDTKAPQGILAVIKISEKPFKADMKRCYIYCDTLQDPGNIGTIIRTADAAGMGGVLLSRGCADLYSPKTVRASMGSFFNIPAYTDTDAQLLKELKEAGFNLYGGTLSERSKDYREVDFSKPCVIIVGNEANGISEEVLSLCDHVKIPILGKAESLNAGVAAAILMYECLRARS